MSRRRRRVVTGATVVLALSSAIGISQSLTGPDAASASFAASEPTVTGEEVDAPFVDSEGLHYGDQNYDPAGSAGQTIQSFAGTAQSALVEVMNEDDSVSADPEGSTEVDDLLGTLLELPAVGQVVGLTNQLLGAVVANIQGSIASWVEPALLGGIKLVAYDTATHQILRTLNVSDHTVRPYAVDGKKIYVAGDDWAKVWDVGATSNALVSVPNLPADSILTDAKGGSLFVLRGEGSELINAAGNVIKEFDQPLLAKFSPDGSHLAAPEGSSSIPGAFVWSLAANAPVPLELPADTEVVDIQWEGDGNLLVLTQAVDPATSDRLEVSAEYSSCNPSTGSCAQLERSGWLDATEAPNSSRLQFAYDAG